MITKTSIKRFKKLVLPTLLIITIFLDNSILSADDGGYYAIKKIVSFSSENTQNNKLGSKITILPSNENYNIEI